MTQANTDAGAKMRPHNNAEGSSTISDAEVQFSPVLREFLRTVNWTYGSVQPTV